MIICYYTIVNTVTIPKIEYKKLRQHSSAYLKIVEDITGAERGFAYNHKYIRDIFIEARIAHKSGRTIEAGSVDEALKKFRKK